MSRLPIAIGDLHGRLDLLDAALAAFPDRQFVLLGDYIDRGSESRQVVARVRELVEAGRAVACVGNHDQWMIEVVLRGQDDQAWRVNGGDTTLENYFGEWDALRADAQWMDTHLVPWHTHEHLFFSHAMRPHESDPQAHIWGRPTDTPPYPLPEGCTLSVHGHTPLEACPCGIGLQDGTAIWFIDTGAAWTGVLCALDTQSMQPHLIRLPAEGGD